MFKSKVLSIEQLPTHKTIVVLYPHTIALKYYQSTKKSSELTKVPKNEKYSPNIFVLLIEKIKLFLPYLPVVFFSCPPFSGIASCAGTVDRVMDPAWLGTALLSCLRVGTAWSLYPDLV